MSSSSRPAGGWGRFIPREELGEFAAWQPGSIGRPAGPPPAPTTPPPPPEPDAREWRERVEQARAAGRREGYQDGWRDGSAALEGFKQSFAAQATQQIGALLQRFDAALGALDVQLADAVARTAVQLARQVLRSELHADPAQVARVAAEAVEAVMLSARQITLRVHPQDLPLVAEGADEVLKARGARLVADATLEPGGVLVESDVGSVDARIEQRWQQAAAAVARGDVPWHDALAAPAAAGAAA